MNVASLLTSASRLYPSRDAITFEENTYSYEDLNRRVDALAAAFAGLGLTSGDRVVVWAHNRPEVIETFFACWRRGLVVVPVNARLEVDEVAFHVADSGAAALVHGADFGTAARGIVVPHRIEIGDQFDALVDAWDGIPQADAELPETAPAWLFYTSGTTGRSKGATLTHGNLGFVVVSWCADLHALQPEDVVLHCAPLSHGAGFHALVAATRGAHAVIHERFEPSAVLEAIARHRVTTTWMVPTQIRMLLDCASLDNSDVSSLTHVVYGGSPMHAEDLAEAVARLGPVLVQIYAQGESPMTITYMRRRELGGSADDPKVLTSAGVVRTGMEVRVVSEDGSLASPGEAGEIVVRGPAVMAGYWGRSDATAETLRGGWLHTGDVGRLDERGYLYVLDRIKDLIITGGSNVYAVEVEEVLLSHPAVHEAAVFGAAHRVWGEVVTAAVVTSADVTPGELESFCKSRMTNFKRPRTVYLVDVLPRNAYGKVLKRNLRDRFVAETEATR